MNSNNTPNLANAKLKELMAFIKPIEKTKEDKARFVSRSTDQIMNMIAPAMHDLGLVVIVEEINVLNHQIDRWEEESTNYKGETYTKQKASESILASAVVCFSALEDGSKTHKSTVIASCNDSGDAAGRQLYTYLYRAYIEKTLAIPTQDDPSYEKRKQYLRKEMETQALESGDKKPEDIAENTPEEAKEQPKMKWATISKCSIPYETDNERIMLIQGKSKTLFIRLTDQQLADKQAASA